MKNRIAFRIAWLQLFLLFFAIVPRELVHELQGCEDTDDCITHAENVGLVISPEHHHCELMQLDAPLPFIPAQLAEFSVFHTSLSSIIIDKQHSTKDVVVLRSSRAPPAG